jgi:uncharacterized membrane protein
MLPPIPSWDGLHPLVVHFPIALLLVAPVFVILGLVFRKHWSGFAVTALVLMVLGTIGAFIAVATGEAGASLVERTEAISEVLEQHEDLAETTRTVFAVLTIIFAAILIVPVALRSALKPGVNIGLNAAFLVLYAFGALLLANAAHEGGRLVHEYGVQALTASGPSGTSLLFGEEKHEEEEHEDD